MTTAKETEEEKADHLDTAYDIMANRPYLRGLEETKDEIYDYKQGKYELVTEEIRAQAHAHMVSNGKASTHNCNEVINDIRLTKLTKREEFDKNLDALPVSNGLLNTQTRVLEAHNPDYLNFTQFKHLTFNPEAKCPKTQAFLESILPPEELKELQKAIGYLLYKRYTWAAIIILIGPGANGKTTLLRLLTAFLGKDNVSGVSMQSLEDSRFAASQLYNKFANLCGDLSYQDLKSTGNLKKLTGQDRITSENKFKDPFNFDNYAKLWFSCNRLPTQHYDDTPAFWRRLILFHFNSVFNLQQGNDIPNLIDQLTTPEELSGLLNYALDGLKLLFEEGGFKYTDPDRIKEEWTRLSDSVGAFCLDMIEQSSTAYITKSELFSKYIDYCKDKKIPALSEDTFHKKLHFHVKIEPYRPNVEGRPRSWLGVQFKQLKQDELVKIDDVSPLRPSCPPTPLSKDYKSDSHSEYKVRAQVDVVDDRDINSVIPSAKTPLSELLPILRESWGSGFEADFLDLATAKGNLSLAEAKQLFNRLVDDGEIGRDGKDYWRWAQGSPVVGRREG